MDDPCKGMSMYVRSATVLHVVLCLLPGAPDASDGVTEAEGGRGGSWVIGVGS